MVFYKYFWVGRLKENSPKKTLYWNWYVLEEDQPDLFGLLSDVQSKNDVSGLSSILESRKGLEDA